jgi:hypothetical protein
MHASSASHGSKSSPGSSLETTNTHQRQPPQTSTESPAPHVTHRSSPGSSWGTNLVPSQDQSGHSTPPIAQPSIPPLSLSPPSTSSPSSALIPPPSQARIPGAPPIPFIATPYDAFAQTSHGHLLQPSHALPSTSRPIQPLNSSFNSSFASPSTLGSSYLSLAQVRAQLAKLVSLPSETPAAEQSWASKAINCPSEVRVRHFLSLLLLNPSNLIFPPPSV